MNGSRRGPLPEADLDKTETWVRGSSTGQQAEIATSWRVSALEAREGPTDTHDLADVPFGRVLVDGQPGEPRVGDRFVYDQNSGTVHVYRDEGDVTFQNVADGNVADRVFVGRAWNRELTEASAQLYARLGGLAGRVVHIEGSHPSLSIYEVIG